MLSRTQADEDTKPHGKLKLQGKKTNLDQEETVEQINLPNIPLPVSTLPNFNFMSSVNVKVTGKSGMDKEETFTFASPIKVSSTTKNLKSINNFTFSSPINAGKQSTDNFNDYNSSSKKVNTKSDTPSSNSVSTVTQNFVWSSTSTAPRPKEKVNGGDSTIPAASSELKSGSVMDILLPKSDKTEPEKSGETGPQLHASRNSNNKANMLFSSTDKDDVKVPNSKRILQQDSSIMWECSECLIRNNNSETQCVACKTAKPNFKKSKISDSSSILSSESQTATKGHFGSQFKLSSSQWECTSCYVRNSETDTKCVACSSFKPDSKHEAKLNTAKSVNSDPKKSLEGSKSSLLNTSSKKDKTIVDDVQTSIDQTPGVSVNLSGDSDVTKTESMDKFKPSKDTWECPCCMVRNAASADSCPCCNTTKPSSGSAAKNVLLLSNGFGDKFKKPEGAWSCDACMLQNKATDTECVACGGLKPGSKKTADNSSTTSTGSSLQFNFGIPPSAGGFKFGIDKSNQQKTDSVTPMNGFKFGESQASGQSSQFTFGIQKDETKTSGALKSENSAPSTAATGFGFQVNAKSNEKTDIKQASEAVDKKSTSSFSFGVPKSNSGKVETDKQAVNAASSTTLPPTFTFGVPKSDVKQPEIGKEKPNSFSGNTTTEVLKPNTEATGSSGVTNASTLTSLTQSSSQESKRPSIFSFGVPSSTVAANNSTSLSVATSLPSTQSSFAFSETKPAQAAPAPTFGQVATPATASASSSTFTFGENKKTEGISAPKTFGALSNTSSGSSIFSSISSAPPMFGATDAKTTTAFGAQENKPPAFGATASKSSAFAMSENKVATFGSTENKPSIFGSTDAKVPVFGGTENKTAPLFNPTPQAPAATPAPTFSAPAAAPSLFGSSAPVFGSNTSSTFATESKPNIFGSTSKPADTNTPNSNLFTFNAPPAQPVAQPATGFNFSANTNPASSNQKPLFTFGSGTTAPQSNNVFGGTFNSPASSSSGFTFNAPKPEAPAFGQSTVASPIFGAPQSGSQDQPSSSFSSTPANTGFNFGAAAPATSSGGFNFGAVSINRRYFTGLSLMIKITEY